nr:MAG TPA: hypothetical protein [Caudoviricetes sp.]
MMFDKLYFFIFNILRSFDDYIIPPIWWYVNTFIQKIEYFLLAKQKQNATLYINKMKRRKADGKI